jgi:ribose transport system permease protein
MSSQGRRRVQFGLDRFSGVYLWIAFIAIFGVMRPHLFLTRATTHVVADQYSINAMLGLAVLLPLCAGSYDLSIGATVNLSAVIAVWLQNAHHVSAGLAIAAAIAASIAIGLINSLLVVRLHISSFISTLGMATVLLAIQEIIAGSSQPLPPTSHAWAELSQHQIFGFQIVVVYMLVLAVAVWWLLTRTPAGRYMFAIGANPEAARLTGVKVNFWTSASLVMCSTVGGMAGVLYASQNGPSLTFGSALLLPAFSAAFLGFTQITPGRFNVWGTLLAVFALATGVAGLQLVTGVQWLNDMFNGAALLVAVAIAQARRRQVTSAAQANPPSRSGTGSDLKLELGANQPCGTATASEDANTFQLSTPD